MRKRQQTFLRAACAATIVALAGCGGDMSDLRQWVEETKDKPGGRIDELPTVEPYTSYSYQSSNLRSTPCAWSAR